MNGRYAGRYDLYRGQTPAQTLGPFFRQGLVRTRETFTLGGLCTSARDLIHNELVDGATQGERLRIEGVVWDGLGQPVPDALVEIWQADAQGRYSHPLDASERSRDPAFHGLGRAATDDAGRYHFDTIKPGAVPGQAPHINVIVGARGMARLAFTRLYFPDEPQNARDPVLLAVPADRRHTLVAHPGEGGRRYVFDIHLQGHRETVFFDF